MCQGNLKSSHAKIHSNSGAEGIAENRSPPRAGGSYQSVHLKNARGGPRLYEIPPPSFVTRDCEEYRARGGKAGLIKQCTRDERETHSRIFERFFHHREGSNPMDRANEDKTYLVYT